MSRNALLITMLVLSVALPLAAQTQQDGSLGDLERQLREQREKYAKKASKVFTNDNMPAPPPWEATAAPAAQPAPGEQPSTPAPAAQPALGGQPSTPAPTTDKPATPPPAEATSSPPPEPPGDKSPTRDYWQAKFKSARQDVAKAKEQQQLAEDELNLWQIQQAREIDPNFRADLTTKVQAKQSEVDLDRTTTEAAQKILDDLEKEFKESGAPDDWSQTDQAQ